MALDARRRSSIYGKLVPVLGEDDANALMTEFPSIEADELVTKQFLRAELAVTRGDLRAEIAEFRAELKDDVAGLRTELKDDIAGLRTDLKDDIAGLRTEMHRQSIVVVGTIIAATAALDALTTFV